MATTGIPANAQSLIPAPQKLERREGTFQLKRDTRIQADAVARPAAELLAARLRQSTGLPLALDAGSGGDQASAGVIVLTTTNAKPEWGAEGYQLAVRPDSIVIRANEAAGAFYGAQSLLQLLPPEVFSSDTVRDVDWRSPCVQIQDWPRFKWRGFMLDVSRHFFNKEEIKRVLDLMALYKLNTFHWHLVDDHGWRIEIKKYPRLTEVGAWRPGIGFQLDPKSSTAYGPDGRYGGYYTQDDIREVVAYAQSRHITIVPEIEMPGHSTAALAAYPQFSCTGGPFELELKGGVFHGVYCAGNDGTFAFLEDVLSEVIALFPGSFVHTGGDEAPKDNWKACAKCQARMRAEGLKTEHELQSYFIRRVEKFINARGRRLIGWSEILEGGLARNAAVMDWIGGAVEAATNGHDVVMSPTGFCYFDYYQSRNRTNEPRAIGGYLPLSQVYSFEPLPAGLAPAFQSHLLGAQGNLWTEYVPSLERVEYMAFPRLCAMAEVVWSPRSARNLEDFIRRLRVHTGLLDRLKVNYRPLDAEAASPPGPRGERSR